MTVEKQIRVSIDWLRYSMPWKADESLPHAMMRALPPDGSVVMTGEILSNSRGYNVCYGLSVGRIHAHTERRDQMISVEFSGQDCSALHAKHFPWAALWGHIHENGGHITRIDFAVDVFGYGADHIELERAIQDGRAVTKARSVYTFAGGEIGKGRTEGTTYVGKPSSERQLRCYNKGAERGTGEDWTRIELVVRGRRAKSLLGPLRAVSWPIVARSTIAAFVQWDTCEWWVDAMDGDVIAMPRIERKVSNTVAWLIEQVAPVLQRELLLERENGEYDLVLTFEVVLQSVARHSPASPL